MDVNLIPQVPNLRFDINNQRIGMVSSIRETMTAQPIVIRSMGKTEPVTVLPGALHYVLSMTRLLLDTNLIPAPIQLRQLHGFTLKILSDSKVLTFSGCEISRLVFSSDMEQGMVEQVEIIARSRSEAPRA